MTRSNRASRQAPLGVWSALAVCGCLALSEPSSARDTARVQQVVVGRALALAACEGLHASNDHRAASVFPQNPQLVFQVRIPGGIGQAPASDAAGNVIISHSEPRLSMLDRAGRAIWSERLPSESSCAPLLTSAGTIAVVTRGGDALLFTSTGQLLERQTLPVSDPRRRALAIPTAAGGVLVASGTDLVQLDADLKIVRQARARGPIATLLESGADLVAIGESGGIEIAHATGGFESVANFGGNVQDAVATPGRKLFALVDAHRWVSFDFETRALLTLATDSSSTLSGPPALLPGPGGAAVVADGGFVSLRGAEGTELLRVAIGTGRTGFDPLQRGARGALLVSDQRGAVFAVRSGEDGLLLAPDGSAVHVPGTNCLDPFRPTPTPSGLVLSCRSGQIFSLGSTSS